MKGKSLAVGVAAVWAMARLTGLEGGYIQLFVIAAAGLYLAGVFGTEADAI